MLIDIQSTPNPNALKFLMGFEINENEPIIIDKNSSQKYQISILLFELSGVELIFLGKDFITISKTDNAEWDVIKPQIIQILLDNIVENKSIIPKITKKNHDKFSINQKNLSDAESKIIDIIENRIRPAVARDGGDIAYKGFDNGVVYVEMHGACSGCPSASITLKRGVESMLKHYVEGVKSVQEVSSINNNKFKELID